MLSTVVDISKIKRNFKAGFPEHMLNGVLSEEPDQMSIEELLAKAATWLSVLDAVGS